MKETSESSLAPSTMENIVCVCVCVCVCMYAQVLSYVWLFVTLWTVCVSVCVCVCVCICTGTQLCLTLCNPMDFSPPNSSVLEIFQARILEWDVISSWGDLPGLGTKPTSPTLPVDSLLLSHWGSPGEHSKSTIQKRTLTQLCWCLILYLQPPELWEINSCCFWATECMVFLLQWS